MSSTVEPAILIFVALTTSAKLPPPLPLFLFERGIIAQPVPRPTHLAQLVITARTQWERTTAALRANTLPQVSGRNRDEPHQIIVPALNAANLHKLQSSLFEICVPFDYRCLPRFLISQRNRHAPLARAVATSLRRVNRAAAMPVPQ